MTDEDRASVVQEILAVLRQRAESRKRQADSLEEHNGMPVSVTMSAVVRLKQSEAEAAVADVERWFSK